MLSLELDDLSLQPYDLFLQLDELSLQHMSYKQINSSIATNKYANRCRIVGCHQIQVILSSLSELYEKNI